MTFNQKIIGLSDRLAKNIVEKLMDLFICKQIRFARRFIYHSWFPHFCFRLNWNRWNCNSNNLLSRRLCLFTNAISRQCLKKGYYYCLLIECHYMGWLNSHTQVMYETSGNCFIFILPFHCRMWSVHFSKRYKHLMLCISRWVSDEEWFRQVKLRKRHYRATCIVQSHNFSQ